MNNCLVNQLKGSVNGEKRDRFNMVKLLVDADYLTNNPNTVSTIGLKSGGKIVAVGGTLIVNGNNVGGEYVAPSQDQYSVKLSSGTECIFITKDKLYTFNLDTRLYYVDLEQFAYSDSLYVKFSGRDSKEINGSLSFLQTTNTVQLDLSYTNNFKINIETFPSNKLNTIICHGVWNSVSGDFNTWLPFRNTGTPSTVSVTADNNTLKCNGAYLSSLEGSGNDYVITFDGNGNVSVARA